MIAGILLIPPPDWRDRLLSDGPCGSRAPVATRYGGFGGRRPEWVPMRSDRPLPTAAHPIHPDDALALAWNGCGRIAGFDCATCGGCS